MTAYSDEKDAENKVLLQQVESQSTIQQMAAFESALAAVGLGKHYDKLKAEA